MRIVRVIEAFRHDLAFALRGLARSPVLTLTIVVSLSLGVGANVAVFTALDRVFLQPPPGVPEPDRLRRLYVRIFNARGPNYGPTGRVMHNLSTRDLQALTEAARGTALLAGDYLDRAGRLNGDGQLIRRTFVSPGYFSLLGIRPSLGRFFSPDEDRITGAPMPTVVLSHAFWRNRLGGDSSVVGRTVRVSDETYTVIGVAQKDFEGIELEVADLWLPVTNIAGGNITFLRLVARLQPGANETELDHVLTRGYRGLHADDPDVDDSSSVFTASIHVARGPRLVGVGSFGSATRRINGISDHSLALLPRLVILGVCALVIAVANVGSLLLMRAIQRRREIGIRVALGIPGGRLVRQLVTESFLLSLVAGGIALAVANAAGGLLRSQLSTLRWTDTIVDQRAMALGLGIALVAGILAGLAPAVFALRTDVMTSLRGSSGITPGTTHWRTALLVTQAALCSALLASGGTFLQSLRHATAFDRGFDHERLIQVSIPARDANAEAELAAAAERLRATPGVTAVGRTLTHLGNGGMASKVGPNASDTVGISARGPSLEFVDAAYFEAGGFRVIAGRLPTSADDFGLVGILTESLARALFPAGNAVGKCVHVREPHSPCREVIGVVRDLRWDIAAPALYRVFVPLPQAWTLPNRALIPNALYVRLNRTSEPSDVARLRSHIAPVLAHPEELSVRRVTEMLSPQLQPWRVAATLFLVLGVLGLLAAIAGIYGLMAYDVAQRTREIGVRIALGATSVSVVQLVIGTGLRLVLAGIGVGILVALGIGRMMMSLLFETTPFDPASLILTTVVLLAAGVLASLVPAWRASRVNPARLLSAD